MRPRSPPEHFVREQQVQRCSERAGHRTYGVAATAPGDDARSPSAPCRPAGGPPSRQVLGEGPVRGLRDDFSENEVAEVRVVGAPPTRCLSLLCFCICRRRNARGSTGGADAERTHRVGSGFAKPAVWFNSRPTVGADRPLALGPRSTKSATGADRSRWPSSVSCMAAVAVATLVRREPEVRGGRSRGCAMREVGEPVPATCNGPCR